MLVGLGFQKKHGKSTVAKYLTTLGFKELSFAGPIKQAVAKLYGVGAVYGVSNKDSIIPHVGKTFRTLCEEMGFMLRNFYGDEFIIALLEQKLRKHLDKNHDVVISDVRHPKEFKLVEEYGGFPVRVFKPSVEPDLKYISEVQLLDTKWPYTIINNSGLKELHKQVHKLVIELREKE
jgi:rhodanese-related sulfurtransferase